MIRFFSPRIFSLVFGLIYTYDIVANFPLFRYYPLSGVFTRQDLAGMTNGPAMLWYGWLSYAAIAALIISLVLPKKLDDRIPAAVFLILPLIIFAGGFYREQEWFLK